MELRGGKSGKPQKEDINKPICKLCKKPISAKKTNTTNLFAHLQEHHPVASSTFKVIR